MTDNPNQLPLFGDNPESEDYADIWRMKAEYALAQLILDKPGGFDAEAIRESGLPDPPHPVKPFWFAEQAKEGLIRRLEYRRNRRASSGSVISWWIGTEKGRRHAAIALGLPPDQSSVA